MSGDELFIDGVALSSYECIVRESRAGMTDAEFWADVFPQRGDLELYDESTEPVPLDRWGVCPECGENGACGYDAEGRALIHVTEDDDS